MGIIGARALGLAEFANYYPLFSLFGYFRLWYPGSYDSDKPLNMGTNRYTFELGARAVLSWHIRGMPTRLEVFPSLQIYTNNTDPALSPGAGIRSQRPLFLLENYLTNNFTDAFWAGIDARFQFGGRSVTDGVDDDNRITVLKGGLSAGYQFLPILGAQASYRRILFGDNDASSTMVRAVVTFSYIKYVCVRTDDFARR